MARARKHPHWWGKGAAPHERWAGTTLTFDVVWSSARSRWETHKGKYYFDAKEADRACDFFPANLKHHIGEFVGQPFELMDYQRCLLTRPIFGWKKVSDGRRRFRKVFGFIPKGGGKSPWGAGTGLYLFACDKEAAAEVYACAGDKLQARTVHDNAKTMVEQMMLDDEDLVGEFEVYKDSITHPSTRSVFKVLSADAKTKHGFRPHGVVFDEFHNQPDRDLYEALKKSMIKRRQPVMVMITHAGDDDEGICYEEYEYAKNVLSGANNEDEACLPVVFEAKQDDDIYDEKVHTRVNPGIGITVQLDAIMAEVMESRHDARKKNDVLRYMLNRWVNDAKAWIHVDDWDACDEPMPSDDELRQYPVAFGIDNAQKIDLAAAVAVFRLPLAKKAVDESIEVKVEDEAGNVIKRRRSLNYRIAILPNFWLPEETLNERVKQDGIRYDTMVPEFLNKTDGRIIDADAIVKCIKDADAPKDKPAKDLVTRFPLLKQAQFGYDPAFATEIALRLAAMNLQTVEVLQNYKHLSEACQIFEALVKAKRVIHGGHRLLRLNLEHTGYKDDDAGRMRPVKLRRKKRIDGIVATLIAITRLMVMPEPKRVGERGRARVWTPDGFVDANPRGNDAGAGGDRPSV